jgi:hypothetical protein
MAARKRIAINTSAIAVPKLRQSIDEVCAIMPQKVRAQEPHSAFDALGDI